MIVAECLCGQDVPFDIRNRQENPVTTKCKECGRKYKLKITLADEHKHFR